MLTIKSGKHLTKDGKHPLTHYHTIPTFDNPEKEAFRKHCGKGENAGDQHVLLSHNVFPSFTKQISNFQSLFILSSGIAFDLDRPKILSFCKE